MKSGYGWLVPVFQVRANQNQLIRELQQSPTMTSTIAPWRKTHTSTGIRSPLRRMMEKGTVTKTVLRTRNISSLVLLATNVPRSLVLGSRLWHSQRTHPWGCISWLKSGVGWYATSFLSLWLWTWHRPSRQRSVHSTQKWVIPSRKNITIWIEEGKPISQHRPRFQSRKVIGIPSCNAA